MTISDTGGGAIGSAIRMRELIFGHVVSQTVAAVVRLGVADALSDRPRAAPELAEVVGAPPDVLARFLRTCAALGLVHGDREGRFRLTPLGEWLRPGPRSLRDLAVAMTDPAHWRAIGALPAAVGSGEAIAPQVLGCGLWDYYRDHQGERDTFAAAMGAISRVVAEDLVANYDLSRFSRFVDVGGSEGVVLARVLEAVPAATGVLFDLPEVIESARAALEPTPAGQRIELRSGSFFEQVPGGGDLYLLKHIVHDWSDPDAATILGNCRRAGGSGHTLLLVERVIGPDSRPIDHVADLLMLLMFGGKERTEEEFAALLAGSGYRLERIVPLPMFSLVEARPA